MLNLLRRLTLAAALVTCATPIGAQSVIPPYTAIQTTVEKQVAAGSMFIAGSTNLAVGLGAHLRYLMANPGPSGKTCFVVLINTSGTTLSYAHLWLNPTAGLPTTSRPVSNLLVGSSNTNVCTIKADVGTAMSGGTDTGVDFGIPANTWSNLLGQSFQIPPGNAIGIDVPVTVAASINLNLFWFEQ